MSSPEDSLARPNAPFNANPSQSGMGTPVNGSNPSLGPLMNEKRSGAGQQKSGPKKSTIWIIGTAVAFVIILIVAVAVPVSLKANKNGNDTSSSSPGSPSHGGSGTSAAPGPAPTGAITGGDGSTINTATGSFVYSNKFGGTWYYDPQDPFNNNAQAQSDTKPLNQTWEFYVDKIHGVNLGGWFITEPFITPALYEKYPNALDEWDLSTAMRADTAGGGINQLEDHYKTFITEQDFAEIAGAGLNWVRMPIPFWAIDVWPGEPFLEGVVWQYILQAFAWARKYGLRVNLDLHTMPGSQNGWWHSSKSGEINWLSGVMGLANAQRSLNYIRTITEFISTPEYSNVVLMFGIVNEPLVGDSIPQDTVTSFYLEAHDMIRAITGIGTGHGPFISIHDGFQPGIWANWLPNTDRISLDEHPYFAFGGTTAALETYIPRPCNEWAGDFVNARLTDFGFVSAGEWALALNTCGQFVSGVAQGSSLTGDCAQWVDASTWDATTKADFKSFAMASMDALQNWFFWTWKTAPNQAGKQQNPMWDYKMGLDGGWMPASPTEAAGQCTKLGITVAPAAPAALQPWQTGGAGAGDISAANRAKYPWPPTTIVGAANIEFLPTYTQTGTIETLAPPTFTPVGTAKPNGGNGWFDAQDTVGFYTPVAGCPYPNAWDATAAVEPKAVCTGAAAKVKREAEPFIPAATPMP